MSQPQVLIVGSGPAGLVLALSLFKNGVPARIIEKDAQHHSGERGAGIMPRTFEIEHFLGFDEEVFSAGCPPTTLHFFDRSNPRQLLRTSRMAEDVEPTPAFPMTKPRMLGQFRHQAIMRAQLEKLGGTVELGSTLVGYTQNEDSVTAEIVKVVDGKEIKETTEFKYLIGADGGKSTVRKLMGVDFVGNTDKDTKMYIVDAEIEGVGVGAGSDLFMFQKEGLPGAALRTTGTPNMFQVLIVNPAEQLLEDESPELIQSELTRLTGRPEFVIKRIKWKALWRPNLRIASHFKLGNVFLMGDAAHTHSPTGGQGLNSSVQDAFNLGWKLALVLKGHSSPSLLDTYEAERIPVISEMLQITTDLYKRTFYNLTSGKDIIPKETSDKESPYFRDRRLFQLDVNYRWSPIVFEERFPRNEQSAVGAYGAEGHELRAGDRAPDAPGLTQLKGGSAPVSRFFDFFNPSLHTILIFCSASQFAEKKPSLELINKIGDELIQTAVILPAKSEVTGSLDSYPSFVIKDTDGHAFTGYGITGEGPTFVIVRPDGMIGSFSTDISGVEKYLKAIFETA